MGQRPFGYFWVFPKVTRCKSGTISGRYRSNGYALPRWIHTCRTDTYVQNHNPPHKTLKDDRHKAPYETKQKKRGDQ